MKREEKKKMAQGHEADIAQKTKLGLKARYLLRRIIIANNGARQRSKGVDGMNIFTHLPIFSSSFISLHLHNNKGER
jgi:hypothetical protein